MEKSKSEELENKVLEIGKKYKKADKLTKIEVGKKMLGKRRKIKKKKSLEILPISISKELSIG